MPAGRPTDYKPETAAEICERLSYGESLRTICKADDMPAASTVFRWLTLHPEFSEQYSRAREAQGDALFDDILEIADDARNDWMAVNGEDDIGWRANGENIQRSRLRVDARKWMASKLAPKKYGDKVTTELTGKDGGPIVSEVSDRELARAVAMILSSGLSGERQG